MKTIAILAVLAAMHVNAFAQDKPATSPPAKVAAQASAPATAPLSRRAGPMGVRLQPGAAGGLQIAEVVRGSPAAEAGLESGFRLVSVQGKAIDSREQLASVMRSVRGGEPVQVQVQREGEPARTVTVTLQPPAEMLLGNTVRYDSVQVPAGYRLRTIITQPNASPLASNGKLPAMLYVQGIVCDSVDRPDRPDAVDTRIIHDIARAGYVTMRVDKPGLGDSEGPPCSEIDLQTELEGYKAALQQLAAMPGVDPERIYLFGHSMGGVLAPYLTAAVPVRGSMVYGTLARTWFEYQLENVRRQAAFQPGATEAEITEAVQAEAKSSSMILVDKKTLGDVWKRWPELEQPTQGTMLDATHMSTRSMAFFHQLQDLNIARAWQDSRGAVLAIWGEYDWVTSQADHQKIVDIVNKRTPGAATLLVMPKADHAFTTHDTMNESVRAMGRGEWDATLPPKMLAWMASVEGRQYTPPEEPKAPVADAPPDLPAWKKLATEAYPGKQDDIFFVNDKVGWYGNGVGKVFRTIDGGNTWTKQWERKGTFVRCLAFVDEKVGVLGNIGPGYFPGVTDPVPVYRTEDGGNTWTPITAIEGAPVVGLCAFDIVQVPFINAGKLDKRPRIIGVGRVGGPVAYIWSDDLGKTWKQGKVPDIGAMAFDVKFLDEKRGFIASATNADVSSANALILATEDGGATWEEVYRSERPFETTWKFSFPTDQVGYCTVQSYNPDPEASVRYVAKTLDGGKTWDELRLVDDPAVREFGIAFVDADTGWVGATPHGFATVDGGVTWHDVKFGNAVNKIRLIRTAEGVTGYAIGVDVHTMHMPAATGGK